jgi:hypothetical protein
MQTERVDCVVELGDDHLDMHLDLAMIAQWSTSN